MFIITGGDWFGQHGQHTCIVLQCFYVAISVLVFQVFSFTLSYCVISKVHFRTGHENPEGE